MRSRCERNKGARSDPIAARILAALMVVGFLVFGAAVVEVVFGNGRWFGESPGPVVGNTPAATPDSGPDPTSSLIDDPNQPDDEVEGYWYCWNTGPLNPHHLGHRIPTDHLCTWGELRSSGFAG